MRASRWAATPRGASNLTWGEGFACTLDHLRSSVVSVSPSAYVGTRKMVNYA